MAKDKFAPEEVQEQASASTSTSIPLDTDTDNLDPAIYPSPESLSPQERVAKVLEIRALMVRSGDEVSNAVIRYAVLLIRANRRDGATKRGAKVAAIEAASLGDF